MKTKKFKVGDVVTWLSSNTSKTGVVVGVVPSGGELTQSIDIERYHFLYGGGRYRDHESYLVAADNRAGSKAKQKLYWPRVSALELRK